jgi:MFS family permease
MTDSAIDRATRERTVDANLPWNFSVNLVDIMFITLGLSLISRDTVIPVLVSTLTDSKLAVGMIPAIWSLGYYLPQLMTANFTERLVFKKPFVMLVGGLGERVPYLVIALVVWLFAVEQPTLTLVVILLGIGMAAFSAGIATPAWFDMIAKVIPVHRRGVWSGLGHSLGAVMGVLGAVAVGRILEHYGYPVNYALLFFLAFIFVAISWGGLALTREPPSTVTKARVGFAAYLGRLPTVLRANPNYMRFLISRSTIQMGAMASGFFMVYGAEQFGIQGAGVGLLTGVLIASQAIMNLVWGTVGDRIGHKVVLTGAALAMALAALTAFLASSTAWMVVTFVLLGAYLAADSVSALNIILEFCVPEDRPTYIGLTNTLLAPVLIVAPLIGGWLATWAGYDGLFIVAIVIACTGAAMLGLWVKEPRHAGLNR